MAVGGTGPLLLVTAVGVCLLMPRAFCMLGCFSFFQWLWLVVVFWRSGASARLGCSSSSLRPLGLRWRLSCGVCFLALWGFCFLFLLVAAVAVCPMTLCGFCSWLVLRFAPRVFFFFFLFFFLCLLLLFLFPFLPLLGFLLLCLSVFSGLLPASLAWCLAFPCAWLSRPS